MEEIMENLLSSIQKTVKEVISFTVNKALEEDMMTLNSQLEEIKFVLLTHERINGMGGVGKSLKLLDEYEFQIGEEVHKMKLCIVKDGNNTPLHLAVHNTNVHVLKEEIDTPLHLAVRCRNFEVVKNLLERHPQLCQQEASQVFPQLYMSKQLDDPKAFFAMTHGAFEHQPSPESHQCKSFRRKGFCSAWMAKMTELPFGLGKPYMASRISEKSKEPGLLWDVAPANAEESEPLLVPSVLFEEEFTAVHQKNHPVSISDKRLHFSLGEKIVWLRVEDAYDKDDRKGFTPHAENLIPQWLAKILIGAATFITLMFLFPYDPTGKIKVPKIIFNTCPPLMFHGWVMSTIFAFSCSIIGLKLMNTRPEIASVCSYAACFAMLSALGFFCLSVALALVSMVA